MKASNERMSDRITVTKSLLGLPCDERPRLTVRGRVCVAHRPFDCRWWLSFRDVKTYLMKLTGRPHWRLLAAIFFGKSSYTYARAEWARRAVRFSGFDADASLVNLCRLYLIFQPVILPY